MKILEFKYFSTEDSYDLQYNDGYCWSRVYEYKFVTDFLKNDLNIKNKKIHNSCWGWQGVHVTFKNNLESICDNVISSDIKKSDLPNTTVYDITQDNDVFNNAFDYIINVSTLEEVQANHSDLIQKQLKHLKENGFLIITFDLPGLQLQNVENLCNSKITQSSTLLTNLNSVVQNKDLSLLNCGRLIIQK